LRERPSQLEGYLEAKSLDHQAMLLGHDNAALLERNCSMSLVNIYRPSLKVAPVFSLLPAAVCAIIDRSKSY
jgi:hypothetical protein